MQFKRNNSKATNYNNNNNAKALAQMPLEYGCIEHRQQLLMAMSLVVAWVEKFLLPNKIAIYANVSALSRI